MRTASDQKLDGRKAWKWGYNSYGLCKTSISTFQKKDFGKLYQVLPLFSCRFNACRILIFPHTNFHWKKMKGALLALHWFVRYKYQHEDHSMGQTEFQVWLSSGYSWEQAVSFKKINIPDSLLTQNNIQSHEVLMQKESSNFTILISYWVLDETQILIAKQSSMVEKILLNLSDCTRLKQRNHLQNTRIATN